LRKIRARRSIGMYSVSLCKKEKFFENVGERIKVKVYMVVMSIERVILVPIGKQVKRSIGCGWGKGKGVPKNLVPNGIRNCSPFLKLSAINKYLTLSVLKYKEAT
jgi:hypothetical protein